jgi:hypothetical protein
MLLRKLLPEPERERIVDTENLRPIRTSKLSWDEQRKLLETNDREKANAIRRKNEELEKDLQLVNENNG